MAPAPARFLPASAASTPFARTALVPAPVTPMLALLHVPLPSVVTTAATPTMAKRDAGCGNFRYAEPVPFASAGTRIWTRSSSFLPAVDIRPRDQPSTFTV